MSAPEDVEPYSPLVELTQEEVEWLIVTAEMAAAPSAPSEPLSD